MKGEPGTTAPSKGQSRGWRPNLCAGIIQDVETGGRQPAARAVLLPEDTVVGLFLQFELEPVRGMPRELGLKVLPQKRIGVALVRGNFESQPETNECGRA